MIAFLKSRRSPLKLLLFLVFVFVGLFYESIIRPGVAGIGDLYNTLLPFTQFLNFALKSGHLPLWNPFEASGVPMTIFSPIFYPLNFLYLFTNTEIYLLLYYFFHFVLAFLGVYLLAKVYDRSHWASISSGLIYSLSGFFSVRTYQGHIDLLSQATWIPWEFLLVSLFFKKGNPIFLYLLSIPILLQVLAGHLQLAYYSIMIISIYFFLKVLVQVIKSGWKNQYLFAVGFFLLGIALGLGLSSFSWLPTQASTPYTTRAFPLTFEISSSYNQPLNKAILTIFPSPFTRDQIYEGINFVGLLPFVLSIIGLIKFRKLFEPRFFFTLSTVAVLLAATSQTPLFNLFYHVLPFFSQMRAHERILIFSVLSTAVLSSFGLDFLIEKVQTKVKSRKKFVTKDWVMVALGTLLLVSPFTKIILPRLYSQVFFPLNLKVYFPTLGILLITYVLFKRKKVSLRNFFLVFLGLLILNFYTFSWAYLKPFDVKVPKKIDSEIAAYLKEVDQEKHYKIWHDYNFEESYLPRTFNFEQFGLTEVQALGRNWLSKYYLQSKVQRDLTTADYQNLQYDFPAHKGLFQLFGVKYIVTLNNSVNDPQIKLLKTFTASEGVAKPYSVYVYSLEVTNPLFYLQTETVAKTLGDPTGIQVVNYSLNHAKIQVNHPQAGGNYLVFNDAFFPGWTAKINGLESSVEVLNFGVKGVKLPPGMSKVEFNFAPLYWTQSLLLTLFSAFLLTILIAWPRLRKKPL